MMILLVITMMICSVQLCLPLALVLAQLQQLEFAFPAFRTSAVMEEIQAVNESYAPISFIFNVTYDGEAIWLTAPNNPPGLSKPSLGITTENSNSINQLGRVVYKSPLYMTGSTSFKTSFTFTITTGGGMAYGECGCGMAFFISDSRSIPNQSNLVGSLGLASPFEDVGPNNNITFFAVEFDTWDQAPYKDPSGSHIGIDINPLISSNVTDTSPATPNNLDLYLYNNSTFTAWIEYDAPSTSISVYMLNLHRRWNATPSYYNTSDAASAPPPRPPLPFLCFRSNLSSDLTPPTAAVGGTTPLYVGFSATTSVQN